jgi:hypothetical protein
VPRGCAGTLIEAERAAARTRDTFRAAHHHRVRASRGANRASLAVGHSLLVAVWHLLQTGEIYLDPGGDYYARRDPPAPPDGSSPSTNASVIQSRCKKCRGRPEPELLFTEDERQRVVSSKRGESPVRIRLSLRCRPPSPPSRRSHFTLAAAPVAWRAIEPEGSRGSLQRARVAQAERLDHGSTGNGCGLVPRHWITDSRCPRWSPVMGSSENAPKKVVVSSRRAA